MTIIETLSLQWQLALGALLLGLLWRSKRFVRLGSSSIDNVPGPAAQSWATGNFRQILNPTAWNFHEYLAKQYGSTVRIYGAFGGKDLYTFDPKAMHHVLVKDQTVFEESTGFIARNLLLFGNGLLGTLGHHHRKQRKMLNPVFSAAHMRDMVPTFFKVTHKMEAALKLRLKDGPQEQEVDILSWMGRAAFELIGQSGLGYSFDPMTDEGSAHPYSRIIKELLPALLRMMFWQTYVLPMVARVGTPKLRRFVVDLLPWRDLRRLRDMSDYMYNLATEIFEGKKRALEAGDEAVSRQISSGNDLISILMNENLKASEGDRLDDSEVISQMSTLIFAAMDTTSSAMSRLLHLLSKHTDVQRKLRDELVEARNKQDGDDLTYDELVALPYLDAVCRETLRLYAPVSNVTRVARQDTVVPLLKPITGLDGIEIREVAVPRGTSVFVSIMNSNRDPDLWGTDAGDWKPERWLSPLPSAVVDAHIPGIYSHLMTFIGGGRSCIGFKFSQLEMKVVISVLVEHFKFSLSAKDSEITWQMNAVAAPVLEGDDSLPQLPIKISLAEA